MWDIKLNTELTEIRFIPFHLNHVGYKDDWGEKELLNALAFIWTMWDIKANFVCNGRLVKSHFHLNHVGYKGKIEIIHISCTTNFHLNHVGYKDDWGEKELLNALAFIWTMWDIKANFVCNGRLVKSHFHLNHVGYKGKIEIIHISCTTNFHLNHVGYKGNDQRLKKLLALFLSSEPCGI